MDLDKAPFFVTLAVAIAGWTANHIVERTTSSPTLEYVALHSTTNSSSNAAQAKSQSYRLTNLTRSTTLKNLTVVFIAPAGTKILDDSTEVVPIPPAFEGNEPWKFRGAMARYVFPKIHPGWTFRVTVGYTGDRPPVLRFESEDSVYAVKPNWETFIVRRELWILLAIGGFWSLFIFWYVVANLRAYISKPRSNGEPERR